MKQNPLRHGVIPERSSGVGTVTGKMVRVRAAELAVIDGLLSDAATQSHFVQAKRELTGVTDMDFKDANFEFAPESEISGPMVGSNGSEAPVAPIDKVEEEGLSCDGKLVENSDKRVSAKSQTSDNLPLGLYELIAQQPFFKGLTTHHLRLLADSALILNFERQQTIFTEGRPANRFYLILEGKVMLESETQERGVMIPVQTLGPGEDLGWSWFFPPFSFRFSARAVEPTKTIFFYGPALREQCERDHELGYQIVKRIAEVATQSLGITQRRLMQYIDKHIAEQR